MEAETVTPARTYLPCDDLWAIATYYNPAGYRTKRENYEEFATPIRAAGIRLITVECAFGEASFELPAEECTLQVRGRAPMWFKERLINLAVAQLPPEAKKVAWLDADILFANPAWAQVTSAQLDRCAIVQPIAAVARLARGARSFSAVAREGFACQLQRRPESGLLPAAGHGHPGIAWAARRSLLDKHGLYDAAILGGGDELFAHALAGGWRSRCVANNTSQAPWYPRGFAGRVEGRLLRVAWPRRLAQWFVRFSQAQSPRVQPSIPFYLHYLAWAQRLYADVRGQVGYVPGMALHLWHGEPEKRRYGARHEILRRHGFDPTQDLQLGRAGLWEWASDKPLLHQAVREYFDARQEDG